MILHDISSGPYQGDRHQGDRRGFETRACPKGKDAKGTPHGKGREIPKRMQNDRRPKRPGAQAQSNEQVPDRIAAEDWISAC